MRLLMAIVWLFVGIRVAIANLSETDSSMGRSDLARVFGMLAFALAIYNVVQWWAARARQKARKAELDATAPPRKRLIEKAAAEYNPEFDFNQSDPPPQ